MGLLIRDSKSWSIWRFSFTRRRAMHINITKVIFSVENTTFSLCLFLFFEYPLRAWGADLFLLGCRFVETPYLWEILLGR